MGKQLKPKSGGEHCNLCLKRLNKMLMRILGLADNIEVTIEIAGKIRHNIGITAHF